MTFLKDFNFEVSTKTFVWICCFLRQKKTSSLLEKEHWTLETFQFLKVGTITISFENILKLSSRQIVFLFGRMENFFAEGKLQFFLFYWEPFRKHLCRKNITIKSFVSSCKERFLGGVWCYHHSSGVDLCSLFFWLKT